MLKNIILGLGAPRVGPTKQLLPHQLDCSATISGLVRIGFRVLEERVRGGTGVSGKGKRHWLVWGEGKSLACRGIVSQCPFPWKMINCLVPTMFWHMWGRYNFSCMHGWWLKWTVDQSSILGFSHHILHIHLFTYSTTILMVNIFLPTFVYIFVEWLLEIYKEL